MSKRTKRSSGNPAATQDQSLVKLAKAMRSTVELVHELDDRLTQEQLDWLKSCAVGLMFTHAELNGLPNPAEVLHGKVEMTPEFEEAFTV